MMPRKVALAILVDEAGCDPATLPASRRELEALALDFKRRQVATTVRPPEPESEYPTAERPLSRERKNSGWTF